MKELFHYYGATMMDVEFDSTLEFSINIRDWLKDIERVLLFLCKHANLSPEWVEAQDISRQNLLVQLTVEMIEAQHKDSSVDESGDNDKDWL